VELEGIEQRLREKAVSYTHLDVYKRQVSGNGPAPESGGVSGLTVALKHGRRIEIARRFDARTLAQLLAVLERV